jgi:hypothetical protein
LSKLSQNLFFYLVRELSDEPRIRLFVAFPMPVATTPQTLKGFPAVGPDLAKVMAVVALCKASLSSVCLYLDNNMVKGYSA